jgi:hypothetical protein
MAKANNKKGKAAMGSDPSTKPKAADLPKTSARGNWKYQGRVWVNKEGYKVDNYGKPRPGQNQPFVPAKNNPFAPKAPGTPSGPGTPSKPNNRDPLTNKKLTPWQETPSEERSGFVDADLAAWMRNNLTAATPFNPGSSAELMDKARQNVMSQFEMQNAEAFKRQEADFYQRAAEQGMDPNNPGYAALYKQEVTDRQDRARQSAMLTAEEAAQSVSKQDFEQQYQQFLAPGIQFGQYSPVYGDIYRTNQQGALTREELAQREEIARADRENAYRIAQVQARAGGGGGAGNSRTLFDQWRERNVGAGYAPPAGNTTINSGTTGVVQGVGGTVTNRLNRPS